jgi:hypothetical protein
MVRMISMTWIPELLRGAVWIYLAIWAAATIVVWQVPKTLNRRVAALLAATAAFGALPGYFALSIKQNIDEQRPIVEQRKAQYDAAMARFEERCKTAGEKIYRTVEDVEGVLLMKVRPVSTSADWANLNWPDAALPSEAGGQSYVRSFLLWEQRDPGDLSRGYLSERQTTLNGYQFVLVVQDDGSLIRYQIRKSGAAALVESRDSIGAARFAVSFLNFVDPEDRKYWIAGTKVTVTDTVTSEVLAEKTWYSVEPGQGSQDGARSPWLRSKTCPAASGWVGRAPTRFFVDQILKPKKGE